MPGPWAWTIIGLASLAALFVAVMAFRGLIDSIDGLAERCHRCGRVPLLPLPLRRHACWACRHRTPGIRHREHPAR